MRTVYEIWAENIITGARELVGWSIYRGDAAIALEDWRTGHRKLTGVDVAVTHFEIVRQKEASR